MRGQRKRPPGPRKTLRDYSIPFKMQVVGEIERGELSKEQARHRYCIQGHSTVLVWLRKYGSLDWNQPQLHLVSKIKTPEQRIKELEAQLEKEKDKNLLLNTIIDVAEEELGVSIRKKPLPEQPDDSSKQES